MGAVPFVQHDIARLMRMPILIGPIRPQTALEFDVSLMKGCYIGSVERRDVDQPPFDELDVVVFVLDREFSPGGDTRPS